MFVVPIMKEVDRKAAARAVGEKTVDMIHVKDILKITGMCGADAALWA